MGEQENITLLKQVYVKFSEGDIAGLLASFAESAAWIYPAVEGLPYAGPRRGREEIEKFFSELAEVEETVEFRQNEFIASGDEVTVLGIYSGKSKRSGRKWESDFCHVCTVRGGKIEKFAIYFNTAEAAKAYLD